MPDTLPFELPTDPTLQLLTGAIYAESSTRWYGGEDPAEKEAIGWTILHMAHYAPLIPEGKRRGYNGSFGDGSVRSAIRAAIVAYGQAQWNKVMDGDSLLPAPTLARTLNEDERRHLELVVITVNSIGTHRTLPHALSTLENRVPVQFNRAANAPPSPARQERIGRLGRHTFYAFKPGRELE